MNETNPNTIDWKFWLSLCTVKLWQACALAVDLDPDKLKRDPDAWIDATNTVPYVLLSSFPSKDAAKTMGKTLRLAETAVNWASGPIVAQGKPCGDRTAGLDVLLSEVASFLVGRDWPISDAMRTLALSAADSRRSDDGIDPADLPEELSAANIAFRAVTKGHGNESGATFRNRLVDFLKKQFPALSQEAIKRISTVANPDKSTGRKVRGGH